LSTKSLQAASRAKQDRRRAQAARAEKDRAARKARVEALAAWPMKPPAETAAARRVCARTVAASCRKLTDCGAGPWVAEQLAAEWTPGDDEQDAADAAMDLLRRGYEGAAAVEALLTELAALDEGDRQRLWEAVAYVRYALEHEPELDEASWRAARAADAEENARRKQARAARRRRRPVEALTVVWYHAGQSYSTDGQTPVNLSAEQHAFAAAFAGRHVAIGSKELDKEVANPARIARRIAEILGANCVRFPRRKGEGYFMDVRPLTRRKVATE
jgi:hypothetical protein